VSEEAVKVIETLRIGLPLYNVYLNEADEWSRRLVTCLQEWALELHEPLPDTAVALAHSLAGSSATVGFTALSDMARVLEHALQHVQLAPQGNEEQVSVFMAAADDIRRLLHQFAAGFLKEPSPEVLDALRQILETEVSSTLSPAYDDLMEDSAPEPQGLRHRSLCGGRAARRIVHACRFAGASSGCPSGSRRCARAIGGQARYGIPGGY
jgi:chemosensory pili system protein ChpA (sensor histidine kinase/response regulator)